MYMSVGSVHQPSQVFYNKSYQSPIDAYMMYKNEIMNGKEQYTVSFDTWKHRYNMIWFDWRAEKDVFETVKPFVTSNSGIDRIGRDIRLKLTLGNNPAVGTAGVDLRCLVTHYVSASIVFD